MNSGGFTGLSGGFAKLSGHFTDLSGGCFRLSGSFSTTKTPRLNTISIRQDE
ncbi:hypothetical protein [Plebeiibacterium marinum]|uniref:Uncharacterized protein n=1 Tax=Plebeiibacterium marinum TaxID=2992111 RepID=A0AAE3MDV0_9BACT|nr:hypothetical protein [Plebeiobacterium marinum]MCW3805202.1 hypothetical protein [Plebeiobacterium marinum]